MPGAESDSTDAPVHDTSLLTIFVASVRSVRLFQLFFSYPQWTGLRLRLCTEQQRAAPVVIVRIGLFEIVHLVQKQSNY